MLVPKEILGYLIEKYGGGPILTGDMGICDICIKNARLIRKRRKMERDIISRYDTKGLLI